MRKLAAIMFTDIVGYTALTARDEEKAFQLLNTQRELLKPIVEEFGGSWLKEIGDGLLLTFPTVSNAVRCAIKIQQATKDIEDYSLRIGIHEGEIIEEGGDVFGDDVNVASRIEPFAAPGGIAISHKVQQDISSLPEFTTKYIGKPKLKGVRQEVKVYRITSHGLPETKAAGVSAKLERKPVHWVKALLITLGVLILAGIGTGGWYIYPFLSLPEPVERHFDKAIAVLYLDNMGAEADQYFADGLTEELITRLARIRNLKVASRTDVGIYRAQPASIQQICEDLNVDYVVEGSVRKAGDQIRVTAQLIKAEDGFHLWTETYDREFKDIFTLQDDVATSIASKLDMVISGRDQSEITQRPTDNLEAYDLALKAKSLLFSIIGSFTEDQFHPIISMLEKAVQLDPAYSDAHAWLAGTYLSICMYGLYATDLDTLEQIRFVEKASLAAEEALALDPTHEVALLVVSGITEVRLRMNLESREFRPLLVRKLMLQVRKLAELYPESPLTHFAKANYYSLRSETPLRSEEDSSNYQMSLQKALVAAEGAVKTGYSDPLFIWIAHAACLDLGFSSQINGDYEKALEYYKRGLELAIEIDNKSAIWDYSSLMGGLYRDLGLYSTALEYLEQSLEIEHELDEAEGTVASFTEFFLLITDIGHTYRDMGDYEKALEYYEQSLEIAHGHDDEHVGTAALFNEWSLNDIGRTCADMEDYEKALAYYEQSLEMARERGEKRGEGFNLHYMGEAYLLGGSYSQSSAYFDSANNIGNELDDVIGSIWNMSWWALADLKSNNTESAKVKAAEVEKMMESTDPEEWAIVIVNWNLSQVYSALGDAEKGKQYLEVAYKEVLSRADRLKTQEARERLLTNIRENREVVAAWDKAKL